MADVHNVLINGGIYGYPRTKSHTNGKLRLLYESAPMAMIIEQAGGAGSTGHGRILDVTPTQIHERYVYDICIACCSMILVRHIVSFCDTPHLTTFIIIAMYIESPRFSVAKKMCLNWINSTDTTAMKWPLNKETGPLSRGSTTLTQRVQVRR